MTRIPDSTGPTGGDGEASGATRAARERLRSERVIVEARIRSLESQHRAIVEGSRWTTDDDEHDPEGSTIAFERAAVASMSRDARNEIRELDAAQSRIENGTYGICEHCGQPIADVRLEVLPTARRCIRCTALRR